MGVCVSLWWRQEESWGSGEGIGPGPGGQVCLFDVFLQRERERGFQQRLYPLKPHPYISLSHPLPLCVSQGIQEFKLVLKASQIQISLISITFHAS